MTETVQILLGPYASVALFLLFVGVLFFSDHYAPHERDRDSFYARRNRTGARLILAAPVWPLALVLVAVKALLYWAPRVWKEAWS
jgi:hypothetical protein